MSGRDVDTSQRFGPTASLGLAADEARVLSVAVAVWSGSLVGLRFPERSLVPAISAGIVIIAATMAVAKVTTGVVRPRSRNRITRPNHDGRVVIVTVAVVFVLAVGRGGHAARVYQPLEAGALEASAVIRGDPEPIGAGWRAELQLFSGERLDATGFGRAGFELRQMAVGDQVMVVGRLRPIGDRPWLRARHIVGRLVVDELTVAAPASGFDRLVNALRTTVVDGAASFDDRSRSLYTGLVIGDDRFQPLAQQAQFRASGLTHLLAVSGQNVAFVLLVVRPLLLLVGHRLRLLLIVTVLVLFVAVTRAEPSVLRAATAAGLATWAMVTGRSGSGLRTLAAGVACLILIDPFLVDVVGFQLSVAASVGIILISPLILARLPVGPGGPPGSTSVAQALAVTVGAQIGVAPVLTHHFGPLPLASIPANLLAGWAAGAVMTLGLTVGPLSGLLHQARFPTVASTLQSPSRLLVDWIDGTARWTADLPLPRVDPSTMVVLAMLAALLAVRPRRLLGNRLVVALVVMAAVVVNLSGMNPKLDRPTAIAEGLIHIPAGPGDTGGATVLVVLDPSPSAVDAVLASGISRVDILVTERGDAQAARLVGALTELVDVSSALAPPRHRIRGATRVTNPTAVTTDWGVLTTGPDPSGSALVVVLPPVVSRAVSTEGRIDG